VAADLSVLTEISALYAVVIAVVVFVGSVLQATFGFGLGVIAGPILLLMVPDLMPEALLVATLGLPIFTLSAEGAEADIRGLRWAFVGRIPGTLLGASVLALVQVRTLEVIVAHIVLVSVAMSVLMVRRRVRIRRSAVSLAGPGGVSGFCGTTVAVGGPPVALLYQDQGGARVRATLASYFLVGAMLSLVTIGMFGIADAGAVVLGAACIPIVASSHYVTARVRGRLDDDRIRLGMLGLSAISAGFLLWPR
jgi:uncharacterized membrane protein YfcA